jgi:hypothetical protein
MVTASQTRSPSEMRDGMTNSNYPERWMNDRRIVRLSDRDHRAFVLAMTWCVANRTDGLIAADDLELLPKPVDGETLERLTEAGLVRETLTPLGEVVWEMVDYMTTQTSRVKLQTYDVKSRAKNLKQNAQRAAARQEAEDETDDAQESVSRLDQTRPNQTKPASTKSLSDESESDKITSWPVAHIPRAEPLPVAVGAESDVF